MIDDTDISAPGPALPMLGTKLIHSSWNAACHKGMTISDSMAVCAEAKRGDYKAKSKFVIITCNAAYNCVGDYASCFKIILLSSSSLCAVHLVVARIGI